ncbi:dihydroneopterin aldolase [Pedobacter arcticus]|uniref:dihydroneopterin aldolase n=1 Tax=Pedobacter arcticus TaxID=752140 RepID=UPI0002FE1B95|nr:dihydroneopterin aldolase [Pedobacter arcticus]
MSETLATVGLNGVKFNAAIGWYPEEQIFKNNFIVDLSVSFKASKPFTEDNLGQSIDYMQLHEICREAFVEEVKLIESVAQKIIDKIIARFPRVQQVTITIKKLSPPVKAQIESVFVSLIYNK